MSLVNPEVASRLQVHLPSWCMLFNKLCPGTLSQQMLACQTLAGLYRASAQSGLQGWFTANDAGVWHVGNQCSDDIHHFQFAISVRISVRMTFTTFNLAVDDLHPMHPNHYCHLHIAWQVSMQYKGTQQMHPGGVS